MKNNRMRQRLINYAALQVLKRSQWRSKFDPDLRFNVDPFDYEDVDDYLDDLRSEWKDEVDPYDDYEDFVDVSDFIDFFEYEEAVKEYKDKQDLKEQYDPDNQFEIDLEEFNDEEELIDILREHWKEEIDPDDEFEDYVDVNDYSNFDEYRDAIHDRKENLSWKDEFYGTNSYGINIDDYDEKEDYLEALKEAWKDEYDPRGEFSDIDPEDYDSDHDYAYAVKMASWKNELDPDEDFDVDPKQFSSKEDYAIALKAAWKDEYDFFDEFSWIKPDNFESAEEYEDAIEVAQEKKEWQEAHDEYNDTGINPYEFDNEMDYLNELRKRWKEKFDHDGNYFFVNPEDFDSTEEYTDALDDASDTYQSFIEDFPLHIFKTDPAKFKTKKDYLDALLKEAEQKIMASDLFK